MEKEWGEPDQKKKEKKKPPEERERERGLQIKKGLLQ